MPGLQIEWTQLEAAFENHAPNAYALLDRMTGELLTYTGAPDPGLQDTLHATPDRYLPVAPIPSREQYQMMERFIETVPEGALKDQLKDCIVGKGAFRRFKDVIGRYPEERRRWFVFRDVLLHQHILTWLQEHKLELQSVPDWNLELPVEPSGTEGLAEEVVAEPEAQKADIRAISEYLQAWARAHGDEYQYLFGPAAFERLAVDISHEFRFTKRKA